MNTILLVLAAILAQDGDADLQKQAALFAKECAKCHTIGRGDRVGPDLKDVTKRRDRKWLSAFIRKPSDFLDTDPDAKALLQQYGGVRMTDLGLTAEQVERIIDYVAKASETGTTGRATLARLPDRDLVTEERGPDEGRGVSTTGLVFVLLFVGISAALWGLALRRTSLVIAVFAATALYGSLGGRANHHLLGDHQGYEPAQPIAFSHRLHAGEMGISCLYCHHAAEKGPVAGIPAVSLCMNCHALVKNRKGEKGTSPELAKLFEVWEHRNEPGARSIEWVRVHRLPDHVTFSHKAHVQNGVLCQSCHGPVQTMEGVRQASDLTMGWCINCHRHEDRPAPTHWQRADGPLDCSACHQ